MCLIEIRTLAGHTEAVTGLAQLNNGYLASASDDKTIKIWDTSAGRIVHTMSSHSESLLALENLGLNGWLASSSEDKTIKIWYQHIYFLFLFLLNLNKIELFLNVLLSYLL